MNVKQFLISGLVGGIADFLLGWLFYGIIFKSAFPTNGKENLLLIFLGCLTFAFLVSYIFTRWAKISIVKTGVSAGAILGIFLGLYNNFFYYSMSDVIPYKTIILDILIAVVTSAIVGGTIAFSNSKIK